MSLISIPINFTLLYTTNTKCININPNWTIKQLYESISSIIKQIFQINKFVLIEKNNNKLLPFPNEAYPSIQHFYNNLKLKEIWTNHLNISFYVKDLNKVYKQLTEQNILFKNDNSTCTICFEPDYLCNRYGCSHYLCDNCYVKCYNRNNECPTCRQKRDP